MIEIAIALAVIAFALVAIIGVLPTGLTVQKQNLEETIINQDGLYFLEAIRSGAEGIYDLSNYVNDVTLWSDQGVSFYTNLNGGEIIGLLSTPGPGKTNEATIRALSGSAVDKGQDPDLRDFAFKYRMRVELEPFLLPTNDPNRSVEHVLHLYTNLYNMRLEFRWPVLANGDVGNGRRIFRTLVAQAPSSNTVNGVDYYFFSER